MGKTKFKRIMVSLLEEDYLLLVEISKKAKESISSQIRRLIRQESEKDKKK